MIPVILSLVLAELPPGVEARTLVEGRSLVCVAPNQLALCDDPTIAEPVLSDDRTTLVFTARRPGVTMCACGPAKGFRLVYEITVQPLNEALAPVVRKIVGSAVARLYTRAP
jgi:hypothetical protein